MSKHFLVIAILLALPLETANAEKKVQVSVSPSIGYSLGKTEYILNVATYRADNNGDVITDQFGEPIVFLVKSQLEYPLDVVTGGARIRLVPVHDPGLWSIEAGVLTSLNDPKGAMKDSDWDAASGFYELTKWSYTESSPEMKSLMLDIEATRRILTRGKVQIAVLAGFRYYKIEQDLFGVDGWQRIFDPVTLTYSEQFFFDELADTQVLFYEVKYSMPQIGLNLSTDLSPKVAARLKTVFTPVWYEDVDDHVLRNKLSTSDGTGTGFVGSLNIHYDISSGQAQSAPFIDFFAEVMTLTASGDQTQEWYGDDPASPGSDDTGLRIDGLPHEVNSTRFHFGVKIGMSL
ncbi:MAG: omptin family outer membrane protease [Candidatus Zixiibacteriota bacterium]|nr:MAG: omptin family outer membrane protease [candidate division Zixibacteria bacterium]